MVFFYGASIFKHCIAIFMRTLVSKFWLFLLCVQALLLKRNWCTFFFFYINLLKQLFGIIIAVFFMCTLSFMVQAVCVFCAKHCFCIFWCKHIAILGFYLRILIPAQEYFLFSLEVFGLAFLCC